MADSATIYEVGPRDGLQSQQRLIATSDKIALIDLLSDCGLTRIEVASFVSPKLVPQMADGAEVMAGIIRRPGVTYAALIPNMLGYEAARAAKANEVAVFASASEGFSRANINASIAESLERFRPLAVAAIVDGLPVRGYISCVTDCPYDGPTPPASVAHIAEALLAMGCHEISLGDTIGAAVPGTTAAMLDAVLAIAPATSFAGHFHDTRGRALDNIAVCLDRGLTTFDSSAGGLGGCPFALGASGNVATEAVVEMLADRGFDAGLDKTKLLAAARFAHTLRGVN